MTLSDIHFPYEDPEALELATRFLREFQPDELYLNGDIWDMPQISKFVPRRKEVRNDTLTLQEHLDYGTDGVARLIDAARPKETYLALGNHEDRWEAYLGGRAKELATLRALDFEEVFRLKSVKWCRYGEGFWINENLFIHHGVRTGSVSWTEKEGTDVGASTITGHMHRQKVTYHTDRRRTRKSVSQGCLCLLNPPYLRTPPNWQQGFVYGYIYDKTRFRTIECEIVREEDRIWTAPDGVVLSVRKSGSRSRKSRRRKSTTTRKKSTKSATSAESDTPQSKDPNWPGRVKDEAVPRLSTFRRDLEEREQKPTKNTEPSDGQRDL